MLIQKTIETFFGLALFVNAALFIPQIIKLLQKKDSSELSFITFAGFNIIQFLTILHGMIHKDYILVAGYLISFITCGIVTALIVYFRK